MSVENLTLLIFQKFCFAVLSISDVDVCLAGGPFAFAHPGQPFQQQQVPGAVPMFQVPPPPMQMPAGVPRPGAAMPHFPGMPFMPPPPPFAFQPPWLSMPLPVPPMPVPNFAELSDEDLIRLEGDHRRALELRVTHLRNIQALLDAAVIQFTQYISLIPPGPPPSATSVPPSQNVPQSSGVSSSSPTTSAAAGDESTISSGSGTTNVRPSVEEDNTAADLGNTNESDEVRRRRLNRFT